MADFKTLLPDIQIEARSCATGLINRMLRWTLQDFCKRTHYWHHDIDPITLIPANDLALNTFLYEIPIPENTRIIAMRDLVYSNNPLLERSADWLDEHMTSWRTAKGNPVYFLVMTERTVRFVPASDKVQAIAVSGRVILEPDVNAVTFGDDLLRYQEGIVSGTLSRLLSMKNRPWTDGPRAAVCAGVYSMAISDAKQEQMRDWSYGEITTEQAAWV